MNHLLRLQRKMIIIQLECSSAHLDLKIALLKHLKLKNLQLF